MLYYIILYYIILYYINQLNAADPKKTFSLVGFSSRPGCASIPHDPLMLCICCVMLAVGQLKGAATHALSVVIIACGNLDVR